MCRLPKWADRGRLPVDDACLELSLSVRMNGLTEPRRKAHNLGVIRVINENVLQTQVMKI